jgi:hypothetical protein
LKRCGIDALLIRQCRGKAQRRKKAACRKAAVKADFFIFAGKAFCS